MRPPVEGYARQPQVYRSQAGPCHERGSGSHRESSQRCVNKEENTHVWRVRSQGVMRRRCKPPPRLAVMNAWRIDSGGSDDASCWAVLVVDAAPMIRAHVGYVDYVFFSLEICRQRYSTSVGADGQPRAALNGRHREPNSVYRTADTRFMRWQLWSVTPASVVGLVIPVGTLPPPAGCVSCCTIPARQPDKYARKCSISIHPDATNIRN